MNGSLCGHVYLLYMNYSVGCLCCVGNRISNASTSLFPICVKLSEEIGRQNERERYRNALVSLFSSSFYISSHVFDLSVGKEKRCLVFFCYLDTWESNLPPLWNLFLFYLWILVDLKWLLYNRKQPFKVKVKTDLYEMIEINYRC